MKPLKIIKTYYDPGSQAYEILVKHSELVAQKALKLAANVAHLHPDFRFIEEAAMLHDIGIFMTDAPKIGCFGKYPYICHGYLGRELLEGEGYPKHALVCERHVGLGISREDSARQNLPLPDREMMPITLEEKIICFADKFYSKNPKKLAEEKPLDRLRQKIAKQDKSKLAIFDRWVAFFGIGEKSE